jgi:hypothetical protein
MSTIPFEERKTPWRPLLDVVSGCYPAFVFGGPLGHVLPVFHFHDVTRAYLEPYLAFLKANGYRTVTSEAMGRWARDRRHPGAQSVVLCFDDAWASMWTVVTPLLREYGMRAVTYAIPGRVADAADVREPSLWEAGTGPALATWPELAAMRDSGIVDVQAHTLSHAKIFCSDRLSGFVTPGTTFSLLGSPVTECGVPPKVVSAEMYGAPRFALRSRMSDALRYVDTSDAVSACKEHVAAHGGTAFFERASWRTELEAIVQAHPGRFESVAERDEQQRDELVRSRALLEERLGSGSIRQVCMPWGVCGRAAERLVRQAGFETAVADRLWGKRYMTRHADPFRIMRLKHTYIRCLPGSGRQSLFGLERKGGL